MAANELACTTHIAGKAAPTKFGGRLVALLLGLLALPALAAFTDNSDGTVTDGVTGLMWDKCSWGQTGNDCSGGSASTHAWSAALGVAFTANNASHRGYTDWRLPNRTELESLVDITKSAGPTIDATAFPNTPSNHFWSSTTYAPDPAVAWDVFFGNGYPLANGKSGTVHVRLVRSGQSFASFDSMGDATAPVLSSVGVSGTTASGTSLAATSDETATGYWIVVARDATAPTSAQVKAGADYGGPPAVTKVASGSAAMVANTAKNFSVTGLAAGTDYDLYFAAEDGSGNLVASPTKVQFSTTAADTTPNAFTFTDQTGVARSTLTESDAITVAGIDAAASISVTGGEYQIGSGGWTGTAGTVTNGQTVKVRHTSSASYATATNTTLTIGGVSDTFSTTTEAAPAPVNGACGSSHGQSLSSAPSSNLCTAGSAGGVAGSGPWTWTCAGSNGGTDASCSVSVYVAPAPTPEPPAPTAVYITGPNQTLAPTGSLPVELASGVDASGTTINLPAGTAVTLKFGGVTFVVTAQGTAAQLVLRRLTVNGQTVTVAAIASGTVQVVAQGVGQTLLAVGDIPVQAGGADARLTATRDGDSLVLSVSQGFVVLPGASLARSGKSRRVTSAEFSIYAGERATLDADGQVTKLVLGSAADGAAGDPLTLDLPNNLSIAATVPNLAATAARLGGSVQTAMAEAAGGTLSYSQTSNGVLAITLHGQQFYLLPLGEVGIDPERADGVTLDAVGMAMVSAAGVGVHFVPSFASLSRFAEDLAQVLPGAQLTVQDNGAMVATVGTARFVVRPEWGGTLNAANPAGFGAAQDGSLTYTQNTRHFMLYPAFADFAKLSAAVAQALPGASVQTNADGTVTVSLGEARYTLTPANTLETAPAGNARWWVGADGKPRLRNADGTMQEFRIE